ncbi:hypothetical protein Salat_2987600 [Sesamum alatum]|uniref:Uncharacterized protein n=1 Tax=Sesamum alatum TaxID=300844 RepID=A0AAE1XI96_9LAMI|nr:hypothetical protein Salat_2964500 [Sesamum alatum]KAK4412254.1 hypothetical protein Salat_2987600 [Sesamum alatum]
MPVSRTLNLIFSGHSRFSDFALYYSLLSKGILSILSNPSRFTLLSSVLYTSKKKKSEEVSMDRVRTRRERTDEVAAAKRSDKAEHSKGAPSGNGNFIELTRSYLFFILTRWVLSIMLWSSCGTTADGLATTSDSTTSVQHKSSRKAVADPLLVPNGLVFLRQSRFFFLPSPIELELEVGKSKQSIKTSAVPILIENGPQLEGQVLIRVPLLFEFWFQMKNSSFRLTLSSVQ